MSEEKKQKVYGYLYIGYFVASLLMVFFSLVNLIRLYLFNLNDATVADIFLTIVLLMTSFFFRYNAFHYQVLYLAIQEDLESIE